MDDIGFIVLLILLVGTVVVIGWGVFRILRFRL